MRRPEQAFHVAAAKFLRYALREPDFATTFPAGGGGWRRGAFLKAMGMIPGVADILVFARVGGRLLLCGIELKSAKGIQSAEQKLFQRMLEAVGGHYFVARSLGEIEGFLTGLGVSLHAEVMTDDAFRVIT